LTADMNEHSAVGPDHQLPASAPARPRHKVRRVILWSLSLLVLAVVFVLVLHHHEDAQKAAAAAAARVKTGITVTSTTAQKGDIGVYLNAIGTVTPVYTASITSQVNGMVLAVQFKEGQRVEKGDSLVDIDPRPYRATLLQAQGALQRDENLLAKLRWTWNAIATRGRAKRLPSKSWMTRKSLCSRTRAR